MFTQGVQSRTHYPSFNEQRPPSMPHRQNASGGFSSNYGQQSLNRSYHKIASQGQTQGAYNYGPNPRNNNNNFSRSRVSMGSSQVSHLSQLANEPDVFPEELVFLLRSE